MSSTLKSLRDLMTDRGLNQTEVAAGIGMSEGVISQYLGGTYPGDKAVANLEAKLDAYISLMLERDPIAAGDHPFVHTSITDALCKVARKCHREGRIGLCVAPAGVGKTRAMKEYANRMPGAIMLEAHHSMRTGDVITEIYKALKLKGRGNIHFMIGEIVKRLKGSGRILMIDEAEHLTSVTLDEIRRIHDWAGVGVLYVGTPKFRSKLASMRGDYDYITSRTTVIRELGKLTPQDTAALVQARIPDADGICSDYHRESKGVARTLVESLIPDTLRLAKKEGALKAEMITAVAKQFIV